MIKNPLSGMSPKLFGYIATCFGIGGLLGVYSAQQFSKYFRLKRAEVELRHDRVKSFHEEADTVKPEETKADETKPEEETVVFSADLPENKGEA